MVRFKRKMPVIALFLLGTTCFTHAEEQARYELGLTKDISLTLSAAAASGIGTWLYYQMRTPDHLENSG